MMCLFLLGCKEESFLLTEEENTEAVAEEAFNSDNTNMGNILSKDGSLLETSKDRDGEVDAQNQESVDSVANSQNQESTESEADSQSQENSVDTVALSEQGKESAIPKQELAVHVCGAVKNPGVYYLEEGKRICDAIEAAAGFTIEADENYLNQALLLQDGMKVYIPTKEETQNLEQNNLGIENAGQAGSLVGDETTGKNVALGETKDQKIDLNTADITLLCTLPGIGESRAKSIISYREKNGPFEKIEDVMKISGIKKAAFEKIKDKIMVTR